MINCIWDGRVYIASQSGLHNILVPFLVRINLIISSSQAARASENIL